MNNTSLKWSVLGAIVIVFALGWSGCAGTETGNPLHEILIQPLKGGEIELDGVRAIFEPGDLPGTDPIEISLMRIDNGLPGGFDIFGAAYRFDPPIKLLSPAEICFPLDDALPAASLIWAPRETSTYDPLAAIRDQSTREICAEVDELGMGFIGIPGVSGLSLPSFDGAFSEFSDAGI